MESQVSPVLFNAKLRVHYSAAAVPLIFVALGLFFGFSPFQFLHIFALTLATAACLFLHELGHVAVASMLGVETRSVTLYPIGAISRLKAEPETPGDDIMIALSGPVVSLLLASFCFIIAAWRGYPIPATINALAHADIFGQIGAINIAIACLNLVPVLPLDGGRIARSSLALFVDYESATRYAMWISVVAAAGCFVLGFTHDPGFFLAGAFLWFGATRDAYSTDARSLLRPKLVTQYLTSSTEILRGEVPLAAVFDQIISLSQKDFPVMEQGRVTGFVSGAQIRKGLQGARQDITIGSLVPTDFFRVHSEAAVSEALDYMSRHHLTLVPVFEDSVYLGVVTKADAQHAMFEQSVQEEAVHHSSRNMLS